MPTFVHGKSTNFTLDDTSGSVRNISDTVTSVDFPDTIDLAETTAFGSSAKSYIVGLTDATLSISGIWDATVDGYLSGGAEPASRSFVFGPAGSTAGNVKYTGEAIVTSYSISNPVGDVVTYSLDLQVTGPVTRTTY
ncbi:Phage major tail protein TP901-1 [uncultured Caudovirales phage]|uniref:Phage major tail protein TP901-1 n=1 Tax=uncultured Caudovirales phage TaxID=2100421 RepID=A0A6J5N968_9CAUD|nr:Phage major tail protein TP901-1 [uncultured Caudovirales phage]